ncbi:zinc finger protein 318-like isoform X9 [Takifugu flavidus]|uniref:zinc finger protein 318-like isoform X9 n=1 Tax=Takifugu flavidus TaxID=433684 RepID=UPI0025449A0B|nr:zinc finger protein 318-like isoform X9 [Takifugu flavidus]
MMNSLDWEDSVRKWQTTMNTYQKNDRGRMENPSGTHGTHQTSCHYRADTVHVPDTDPEDQELTRKLKELRGIEERKICREASPACKTVLEPSLGAPGEQSCRRTGTSLKERVNAILQQRQSNGFLSQSHFRSRIKSSDPSKGDKQLEDHPLKSRVKMLMTHRRRHPCVSPSITQPPPPPPPQRAASSLAENSVDQGFQRFLNVLNKGVDVDLLRKIVNADSEDLCLDDKRHNIQQNEVTDMSFRERPYSNDGNSLGEPSGQEESSTDPRSQERSQSSPIPDEDEKKEEELSPFSFRTSAMRNNKEDEEKIKHDQQHEQLQNILKSLGLQLEKEEMSQLANRTQERLYGKKTDNAIAQSRRQPDRHPKGSPRSSRGSSSSSCSCSSSRSRSSSSSYCGSSRSNVSKRRSNGSPARSGENLTGLENNPGTEKRLKTSNEDQQQSCAETQAWPPPNPSYSLSPLPDYTLSQYSQYSAYSTSSYHNTSSYWTYSQVATHPSFYPSSLPYAQNQCHNFPVNFVEHPRSFPDQWQMAPPLDQQCLPTPQMNMRKWRKRSKKKKKKLAWWWKRTEVKVVDNAEKKEPAVEQQPAPKEEGRVDQCHNGASVGQNPNAKNSEKSKNQLPKEEIKANLGKTCHNGASVGQNPKAKNSEKSKDQLTEEEIKANLMKTCHNGASVGQNPKAKNSEKSKHKLTEEEIKANLRKTCHNGASVGQNPKAKNSEKSKDQLTEEEIKANLMKTCHNGASVGQNPKAKNSEKRKLTEEEIKANLMKTCHNGASVGQNPKAKNSEKSKHKLTEEEIKANLRKTLEAFNRKAKQALIQPVSFLTSQADEGSNSETHPVLLLKSLRWMEV